MTATLAPETPRLWSPTALRAVTLLRVEVWLLALIPGGLVVGPLGGVGSPALLLGLGLFAFWLISVLSPGLGVVRCCTPLRVVLGAFWCVMLLSYAVMNAHAVPFDEAANATRFLIAMVAFSGVVLTGAEGLRDLDEVRRVLRAVVAGVAVMAVIGILQFQPGIDLTIYLRKIPFLTTRGDLTLLGDRGGFTRPSSTALHPIEFGVIVASTLACALHVLLYDRVWRSWQRWAAVAAIGFAVPVSISRSALLAATVVLVFFFAGTTPPLRRRGLAVLAVFVMFIFVAVPGMLGTLKGFVFAGSDDSSITARTDDYAYTANFINDAPWLGRGPGSFIAGTYHILDNQYLLSLVEIGVVGVACLIAVLAAPMFLGRGLRRRSMDEEERNLGQMLAASAGAALVSVATFDGLSYSTFTLLAALTSGLAGAAWCVRREVPA